MNVRTFILQNVSIKYITKATPTYKFSATITVNLSRYGELGKVTFDPLDIDTALLPVFSPAD